MLRVALALACGVPLFGQAGSVVVSQIYGGGGNNGAPLRADFIEIFNRSGQPVNVAGWTVQYASAAGTTWETTPLTGALQPGQYVLVQETVGDTGVSLPVPDATGAINLSAISGKVALVSSTAVLSGSAPSGPAIVDLVAYGTLDNATAFLRHSNGCVYTNSGPADFTKGTPTPRNSKSPLNLCSASPPPGPAISAAGIANAASFAAGPLAPGEIVILYGSGMGPAVLQGLQLSTDNLTVVNSLAGTRVLFNGTPAPLIYTRADIVSAVVPYSVGAAASVDMQVEYNGILSNKVTLPVAAEVPAIFSANTSGQGQGVVQNEDYAINTPSRPAAPDSVIIIYATGAGTTDPPAPDGAVIGTPLPIIRRPVSVLIDGIAADVLYAGMGPQLVNGVFEVIARVPKTLPHGGSLPLEMRVDNVSSQAGVTIAVQGPAAAAPGTGPLIEQRLAELRSTATPPALPEIPNDRSALPRDWLGLISWNTQVGATSTAPGAERPPMVQSALSTLFGGTYQLLAAQEIPNLDSANLLASLLPGGATTWKQSFFDSSDTMDNGFWFRSAITLRDAFPLQGAAVHPPQVAQFQAGDFDFTLITVHLTFADGDTTASAAELRSALDYLDWYFNQTDHDPDVIVCGDFNMPSLLSKQTGSGGLTVDSILQQDPRFQVGERRFVVTVHEPTSRSSAASGGAPVSNYDHCLLSADVLTAFVEARRVDTAILTDNPADPEIRLTSDHFPIVAFFRTRGTGIALDRKLALRPPD